jgi:uncharacterized coiled-coil DUF342 family protein
MQEIPTLMSLHLHYRLWIAELNSDINVLRIFDDYLAELSAKKEEPEVRTGIESFQSQFISTRKEIDELRHEMHLIKMKLGEHSRVGKALSYETYREDNHQTLEERYKTYRKHFNKLKDDFSTFEGKWL